MHAVINLHSIYNIRGAIFSDTVPYVARDFDLCEFIYKLSNSHRYIFRIVNSTDSYFQRHIIALCVNIVWYLAQARC